eukprot:TRINITY_DN1416_c0_g2_i3.p1 TRINITY_DN1416_c0_g2~~TRINITY_DN1416_c0_g2_i3.p1  ORF type:complete len:936 (+),score=166.02 TRINITY_DN1416_c0_g2_i3:37-2844(+)
MRRVCLAVLLCSVVAGSEAACLWQPTLKGLLAGTTSSWCTSLCEGDATVSACSLTSSALCQCDTTVLSDATVCDARRECDSSGFNCTSSACMAICSGMRSCQKGLFDCRSSAASGTCTLVCSGYQACTSLTSIPQDQIQEPDTGVGKKTGEIEALVSILPIASACSTQIQSASFSPSTHCGADTRECDIRCEGTESCQALHMQCDAKDSCEFSCTDIRSCKNSEYKCTGKGCKATCSGTEACAGSVMNWKDGDNMAKLDCMGTHSCMDATIECPTSGCVVRCGGFESCKGLTLKCPSNLASGKKCEIQCSGDWACTGVDNAHMCGEVSAVCSGYKACTADLGRLTATGSVPTCKEWVGIAKWGLPDVFCDIVCMADPSQSLCRGSVCTCKGRNTVPPPPPVVVTCANGWIATADGAANGVTEAWCEAVCPFSLGHTSCTGSARFCMCQPKETNAPGTPAPWSTCSKWVGTGASITHTDIFCGTICGNPVTNSVCNLVNSVTALCMCGDVDPCAGTWVSTDASTTDSQCATDCLTVGSNKKCKDVNSLQKCKCQYNTDAPATSSPAACSTWRPLSSTNLADCNSLCNNPLTDVVCKASIPNVVRLCTCSDITPAPVTCPRWGSLLPVPGVDCGVVCTNPKVDDVCYPQTQIKQLCTCTPCSVYVPSATAPQGTDCAQLCNAAVPSPLCSSQCVCQGVTDVPATPIPTVVVTPVPLTGLLRVILRKVFRFMMAALFRLFSLDAFLVTFRRAAQALITRGTGHWVCPLTACIGGCPRTTTLKLQLGCRSHHPRKVTERGFDVLQAFQSDDGTVVEVSVEYPEGADQAALDDQIQQIVKNSSDPDLAAYNIIASEVVETEVVAEVSSSSDDDSTPTWAIVVAVLGSLVCVCCAVGVVFFCCCKKKQPDDNYPDVTAETEKPQPEELKGEPCVSFQEDVV